MPCVPCSLPDWLAAACYCFLDVLRPMRQAYSRTIRCCRYNGTELAETEPMELLDKVIDMKGALGKVVEFRKGKHSIQFEKTETSPSRLVSMKLDGVKFRLLSDEFLFNHATPMIQKKMDEWGESILERISDESKEIAAEDDVVHAAKMGLYRTAQAKQALCDAALAAAHFTKVQEQAFIKFKEDFMPTLLVMDEELIADAGGQDVVLRETWINMPRNDRALIEDITLEALGAVQSVALPTFDEQAVESTKTMYKLLRKQKVSKHYQFDSDEVGWLEEADMCEATGKTKVVEQTKKKPKPKQGDTYLGPVTRVKVRNGGLSGWISLVSRKTGESLLEESIVDCEEPSNVPYEFDPSTLDMLLPFRLTGAEEEELKLEFPAGKIDYERWAIVSWNPPNFPSS